jgi:hypothetical protein
MSYCRDLAERRYKQGFAAAELVGALRELERICSGLAPLESLRDAGEEPDRVVFAQVTSRQR